MEFSLARPTHSHHRHLRRDRLDGCWCHQRGNRDARGSSAQIAPIAEGQAPPDPLALLVEAPWSIGEVLLLLDVVSHFPPSIFGWARIADAYNYALMERSLQEWFAATGTEVDAEDAWMLKAEQRYIARQFQRMHADRTRDASQKAAAEPAIPPTYADVLRRRLQPQPKEQQQPQQGQPQQQGRPHPFCLKVAHRPPLTFPSDLAYVYEAIAEYRAKQQTSANAAGSNEQLADLLRVLYMELNPHFPLRSPWECWHRWCVPYVPSSSDEQKAKMRGEGVSLKDLKDKALKRADQRPPPSPVSPSPVSPSEASSSASPTVSVSHPPTASSSDASPVSPSETRRPKIHPILGNLLAPDVVPPPGTYSDAPGVKRDADSKYDPTGVMKVFTLTTVCDAEPFKAEHGALRSNRIVSEASQLLKGVQEPLTHKPKKGRKVARGKKAEKKQHPNVPVGTFGSHERPGIRTWFENAAVNRAALGRVFGEGSDGPWRKMDTAIAELGPKENAASDSRTQDEQPTDDDDSGGPWLPVHLKKMRVPPAPEWRQARYGSKADSRKRSKD
ncbi:hypothetical protein CERSUDRAFT_115769 [Gelatoporia subvermispora B]|uniref:Uncharacterized protein n=1 Tax=Ceriporiopsis subvermispora (strain B) TaxID=914234 RepID=M2PI94_CERS8|nr:hypothetical protein CERSUDRAFT_115769 [Gelatoporia subvermispora B]